MSVEILKRKEQNIKKLREDLNLNKIPKLGVELDKLYNKINEINEVFNGIKNIPKELELKRFEINQALDNWKFKIEEIEKNYNDSTFKSAGYGAAGAAAGFAFAAMAPTVAMGIATTFGVASTGTAISTLSGAAATNAALAWLGGGALAAGGGGIAFGEALLALSGPIGWGIAAVSIACAGFFYWSAKNEKETLENIFIKILSNSEKKIQLGIVEINERIEFIRDEIELLEKLHYEILGYHKDYNNLTDGQKFKLGSCVNTMHASKILITEPIEALMQNFDDNDYINYKGNDNDVKKRNLFVLLANMLENIYLNEEERKLLVKVMKNNDNFFKNDNIRKEDMTLELLNDVFYALYKKNMVANKI